MRIVIDVMGGVIQDIFADVPCEVLVLDRAEHLRDGGPGWRRMYGGDVCEDLPPYQACLSPSVVSREFDAYEKHRAKSGDKPDLFSLQ